MSTTLALHGGTPVRTTPLPSVSEAAGRTLGEEEAQAAADVVRSGRLNSTVGPRTGTFEQEFAAYYGLRHAIASSSGTAAIHLAVAAANPEPGDEIITTPLSDAGTVLPILAQDAVPVFADLDPTTGNLDVEAVRALISPRTRAIIVVHLFGCPAPVAALRRLADENGILLIEDCAQAYLTRTAPDGALAGTVGHIGCFSLQQSKHITAGDGGLTITDDDALARHARLFADKAWPRDSGERNHLFLGLNYRMTELQSAVASVQLGRLEDVVARRRSGALALTEVVEALRGLHAAPTAGNVYWQFPVFLDAEAAGGDGFTYAEALRAEGIPANGGYIQHPLYLNEVFTKRRTYGSSGYPMDRARQEFAPGLCPHAEALIGGDLLVIMWNEMYTEQDVADIGAAVRKVHAALS